MLVCAGRFRITHKTFDPKIGSSCGPSEEDTDESDASSVGKPLGDLRHDLWLVLSVCVRLRVSVWKFCVLCLSMSEFVSVMCIWGL